MKFEKEQLWQSQAEEEIRARAIEVTEDGLHATLQPVTKRLPAFELRVGGIIIGVQKWKLSSYR